MGAENNEFYNKNTTSNFVGLKVANEDTWDYYNKLLIEHSHIVEFVCAIQS